ncbi:MAG: PilT protein domain protein [Thermomicrobiales bacterium]|jgi:putative PIN family toxin of toxin-antitoxin system|nr:PilT protein domain protein [Thermomicrobiales bacterium]
MRAVLDTIILVRSLLDPFGWSEAIVFDRANEYEAIISPDIVAEYLDVLNRPTLSLKFCASETRHLDAVRLFIDRATVVQTSQIARICRDPEDDKFLAAAVAGGAQYIVSEDNDLLDLRNYAGSHIVTAEAFLRILDSNGVTCA